MSLCGSFFLFILISPNGLILTFIYHNTLLKQKPILYFCNMRKFWKFIVFTGLLIQFSFAYSANHDATISFRKDNNTSFSKESLSISHFVQPSIERNNPDLKHNNRIPVNIDDSNTTLPLFSSFKESNLKIVLSDQDIDRCRKISILLFPFHYFW
ncbi:hypothetical protein C8C85_3002 [Flavobacterium sp. 103]|nr:hypothetical protein C8C85_3002 [Flavobacterium sp. 103]